MHTQSRTLSTSLVAWRFPVSSETMSVAMRGAQYLRSVFVWLDLDFFLWSAVLLDPHLSNDKSADLRARRWCLHLIGRAIGVWVLNIYFRSSPPQGGGCVPSQGYERFEKKTRRRGNELVVVVVGATVGLLS